MAESSCALFESYKKDINILLRRFHGRSMAQEIKLFIKDFFKDLFTFTEETRHKICENTSFH